MILRCFLTCALVYGFPLLISVAADQPPPRALSTLLATAPNVVNVDNFGAKGDGVTDSAPAFNAAVSRGGIAPVIYIPPGTYKLNAPITLSGKSGVRLFAAGPWVSILAPSGNFPAIIDIGKFQVPDNSNEVSGVRINCSWGANHANSSADGYKGMYGYNIRLHDLVISGCAHGIELEDQYASELTSILIDGVGSQQNDICLYMGSPTNYPRDNSHNNGVKAVNVHCYNYASSGFRLLRFDGSQFINDEAASHLATGPAWYIGDTPATDPIVEFGHFVNDLGEGGAGGWYIGQGSNASPVTKVQLANIWAASGDGRSGPANDMTMITCSGCREVTFDNVLTSGGKHGVMFINGSNNRLSGLIADYNWNNDGGSAVTLSHTIDNNIDVRPVVHPGSAALGYNGLLEISGAERNSVYGFGVAQWSPVYAGSATAGAFMAGTTVGQYERAGRTLKLDWSAKVIATILSPKGNMTLTHLPFPADNLPSYDAACLVWFHSGVNLPAEYSQLMGNIVSHGTVINFQRVGGAAPTAPSAVTDWGPSFRTTGSCNYIVQ